MFSVQTDLIYVALNYQTHKLNYSWTIPFIHLTIIVELWCTFQSIIVRSNSYKSELSRAEKSQH